MYHPTTRVLTILELLQSHQEMTGKELARRLEVDPRTVRRYITMLQDMGIPVEAERGRAGAYFIRPGYKLPPLMFNPEEAFAITLSLRLAKQTALYGAGAVMEGVMAKIERVLPETIRQQVQAALESLSIELNLAPTIETSDQVIHALSYACQRHQQVTLQHQTFDGAVTERRVDPYGIVYRVGRWYMVGFCHLRGEIRTFRLDRVRQFLVLETTFEPFRVDVVAEVEKAIAQTPGIYSIEVIFMASITTVRRFVSPMLGQLNELGEQQVRLTCFVQNLSWFAGWLAGIPLPYQIIQPTALRAEMSRLVERVQANLDWLDSAEQVCLNGDV